MLIKFFIKLLPQQQLLIISSASAQHGKRQRVVGKNLVYIFWIRTRALIIAIAFDAHIIEEIDFNNDLRAQTFEDEMNLYCFEEGPAILHTSIIFLSWHDNGYICKTSHIP